MREILLWAMAALVALAPLPAASADEVLRIATEGDYPPFSAVDETGALTGFDVDVAKALCAAMKRRCELVKTAWADIIPGLLNRHYDAIVASMSITEERKRQVAFTNRYYRTPMNLVGRKGQKIGDPAKDLAGRAVAAERDTTAHYHLRDNVTKAKMQLVPTQAEANAALLSGKADFVMADSLVMWRFVKDNPQYEFVGQPVYADEGIGIALRKGEDDLLKAFNQAIARIRLDGTYKTINDKYFPFDIY
ncbi:MAG: transporter substrate-binding domain-containing protein [Alphaproteobacteria bacterium]|nr:transporter substrate-binding domain-containing protein [Alphaproteobacteria bacterium]